MARQVGRIVGAAVKESNFRNLCLACHELAQGDTGQLFLPEEKSNSQLLTPQEAFVTIPKEIFSVTRKPVSSRKAKTQISNPLLAEIAAAGKRAWSGAADDG